MSDGFPSRSCADAMLSLDDVDEDEGRFLPVRLAFGRDRKSAKGTHRSLDQSLKSTLPRRPLVPPEIQGERDSQTRSPIE